MDWKIETILVGVDGSEGSQRAAEYGASLARERSARLLLVTVVRPPEGWWGIGGAPPTPEAMSAALMEGQQKILRDTEELLGLTDIEHETFEEVGDPATRLLAVSEEREADLIVIGRRGASLAERVILGSVADRVCHLSVIPVLVIP
ncbi:MAG: universal stress protein [Acidimicrobiia bacterium]